MKMTFDDIIEMDLKMTSQYPEMEDTDTDEWEMTMAEHLAEEAEEKLDQMEEADSTMNTFYARERLNYLTSEQDTAHTLLLMHIDGVLMNHVLELQKTCETAKEKMLPQMMESYGLTEKMKNENPEKYDGLMRNLKSAMTEIILNEYVYIN